MGISWRTNDAGSIGSGTVQRMQPPSAPKCAASSRDSQRGGDEGYMASVT